MPQVGRVTKNAEEIPSGGLFMESATSTFDLIERLKSGDTAVFPALFQKYSHRLAILIYYKLSPEMRPFIEVDDVLQETFLKTFRDLGQFTYRAPGSFMNWISSIADHVIADMARYQGRQKRHAAELVRFRSDSNPQGPEPADTKTPSVLLAGRERVLCLIEKLSLLPEDYRRVILLAKVEGLSTREVAKQLGKSAESVSLLLHRALKRFRELQNSNTRQ